MESKEYALEVRVHGRSVQEYPHESERWIEGRKGSEFTLRVHNNSDRRICATISVDGLSVMTGETASLNEGGYIIEPRFYVDIPGWRLNNNEIAKFKFHKPHRSYAAKSDKPANIGVIGAAVFKEEIVPIRRAVMESYIDAPISAADAMKSIKGRSYGPKASLGKRKITTVRDSRVTEKATMDGSPSLGTEFGRKENHRVREATFKRASDQPTTIMELRYGDREELKERGVDTDTRPYSVKPEAFPQTGCVPPEDWRG